MYYVLRITYYVLRIIYNALWNKKSILFKNFLEIFGKDFEIVG